MKLKVRSIYFWKKSVNQKAVTAQNTVISPNFLVWTFFGKAQFLHSFGRKCAAQIFHAAYLIDRELKSYLRRTIVRQKTDESYNKWQRVTTSGTTSESKWYNEWQRVTMNDNKWQGVTTSDTTSNNECQRVVQQMKTNETEWGQIKESDFRSQN